MKASWKRSDDRLCLSFRLDPDEGLIGRGQGRAQIELVVDEASFGFDPNADMPHPDLLAIGAFTVLAPWTARRLHMDNPVSLELAEILGREFQIEAGPVGREVPARAPGNRIGISFGGGQDSAAVAKLLPRGNPLVHLRRVKHRLRPTRPASYRPEILARFAQGFEGLGFEVHVVESDLENICLPHPTFPTWPSITIASILHADHLDLGSIATGTVLGSRYFEGGNKLYTPPHTDSKWEQLFEVGGIPLMMPLAGATEATTGAIIEQAGWGDSVRSCPVGTWERPCLTCDKCFRKEIVNAARVGRDPADWLLDLLQDDDPTILPYFEQAPPFPVHHNFEYAFSRIPILNQTKLATALRRIRLNREETRWVERYFPGSIEHDVPERWRSAVWPGISSNVTPMDAYDEHNFLNWDASTRTRS